MAALLLCLMMVVPAEARTWIVGEGRSSLASVLQQAADGDVVEVRGGSHEGPFVIEKTIRLKGIGNPEIHVRAGDMMKVKRSGTVIEGFTFRYKGDGGFSTDTAIRIDKGADGVVIRDNRFIDILFGVWNVDGRDIRIQGNTFAGRAELSETDRGNCINLTGSQEVKILDNTLRDCRDGIYMELCHDAVVTGNEISASRYSVHTMWVDRGNFSRNRAHDNLVGLAIMYTKHSKIDGNLSYGNQTHGLLFIQTVRSEIRGNRIIGNTKGVFLYNSIFNEVSDNLILNNQLGMHNWGGSEDNMVHGNSFIDNEVQVKFVAGRNQEWTNNYWSDYLGWDMTGDGLGDVAYESNTVVDHLLWRYPLAKVLYTSPSLQLLWMLEKQFPVIEVPRVVDHTPAMRPFHADWRKLEAEYPAAPGRIYGDIQKLPHVPGGSL